MLILSSFLRSQLYLWGYPFFGEMFAYIWPLFLIHHGGSHILSQWMVHAGCVFVAGFHLSRTCTHRVLRNGVRTHVNSKRKIPSTVGSEEGRTRSAGSRRTVSPRHYRLSYPDPLSCWSRQTSVGKTGAARNATGPQCHGAAMAPWHCGL